GQVVAADAEVEGARVQRADLGALDAGPVDHPGQVQPGDVALEAAVDDDLVAVEADPEAAGPEGLDREHGRAEQAQADGGGEHAAPRAPARAAGARPGAALCQRRWRRLGVAGRATAAV